MNKKILVLIAVVLLVASVFLAVVNAGPAGEIYSLNTVGYVTQTQTQSSGQTQKTSFTPPTRPVAPTEPVTLDISISAVTPQGTPDLSFAVYQNGVFRGEAVAAGTPLYDGTLLTSTVAFPAGIAPGDNLELEITNHGIDTITITYSALLYTRAYCPLDGMAGYWPLEEGSGTTTDDWSGNGNTGTINGATWTTGPLGNALSFDGNDYVSDGLWQPGSSDVSFAGWIKLPAAPNANGRVIATNQWSAPTIMAMATLNNLMFRIAKSGSIYEEFRVFANVNLAPNTWYHVAATIDRVDPSLARIWVNGVDVTSGTVGAANLPNINNINSPYSFTIGWDNVCPICYFNGAIDEVAIFNKLLTQADVDNMYLNYDRGAHYCTGEQPPVADAGLNGYALLGYDMTAGPDGSGSYDPDGGALTYEWTCKGGAVSLGTAAQATPTWDVWKECCAVTPCDIDDTFAMNLVVTDDEGDIATDSVTAHVKEMPFAAAGFTSATLNQVSPGVFSGSAAISGGTVNPTEQFVNGPISDQIITPMIGRCDLTGATVATNPATGQVTVSGSSGTCQYNLWGVGTEPTIYVGTAAYIYAFYAELRAMAMSIRVRDAGEGDVSYPGNGDKLPIGSLNIDCTPNPLIPNEPLRQTCQVTSFELDGTKLGNTLVPASGADVAFVWENKQFKVSSGALSNVVKEAPNPDGFAAITSANMAITSAEANGHASQISFTGLAAIASSRLPAEDCGQIITASGTTTLSSDILTSKDTAICIQASNVVLDCAGHTITGDGTNIGVYAAGSDLTVSNCIFDNFLNGIISTDAASLTVTGTTINNIFSTGIDANYLDALSITGFTCTNVDTCIYGDEIETFNVNTATATNVGRFAYIDPLSTTMAAIQIDQRTVQQMFFGPPTIEIISGGTVDLGDITINGNGIKVSGGASVRGDNVIASGGGNDVIDVDDAPNVDFNHVTGEVGDGATGIVITDSGNVGLNNIALTGTGAGQGISIVNSGPVTASGVTMNSLLGGLSVVNSPTVTASNIVGSNIFGTALDLAYGTTAVVNGIIVNTAGTGVSADEFNSVSITGGDFDNVDIAVDADYGTVTVSSTDINTADTGVRAIAPDAASTLNLNGVTMSNVGVGIDAFKGVVNTNPVTISAITTGINLASVAGAAITGSTIRDAQTGVYVDANSNSVRLENNIFSNNQVDVNNQDAATGDGNSCDPSKLVNYQDDGQTNSCDTSSVFQYADVNHIDLHTISPGLPSTKTPIAGVLFKVFDRSILGYTPTKDTFGTVYEGTTGLVSSCTTDANGDCTALESSAGNYVVIGKYTDTSGTTYVGSPKDASDFVLGPDGLYKVYKSFQVIKKESKPPKPGAKVKIEGSHLDIIFPDPWLENQYYEVIADAAPDGGVWADVQVTLEPPVGYNADPNPVVIGTVANEVKWDQSYITKVGSDPSDPFVLKITTEEKAIVNPITGAAVSGKNQKKELYVVVEGNGKGARDKALNKASQLRAQGKQVHTGGEQFKGQAKESSNGITGAATAGGIAYRLPKWW